MTGGALTWMTLAMLATSEGAAAHAAPDGRLPPVILPPYEGKTGRDRQHAARERARKKRRK